MQLEDDEVNVLLQFCAAFFIVIGVQEDLVDEGADGGLNSSGNAAENCPAKAIGGCVLGLGSWKKRLKEALQNLLIAGEVLKLFNARLQY